MVTTYYQANDLVLQQHKDSEVLSTMDAGKIFIISLQPKNTPKDSYILDGFFSVDKLTGEIKEYSPVMDPEQFKKAQKNIVYRK